MVFVVFQMKLQSARWTSRLCLGDICYVTPLSRVCVCVDAMCCGRMYATVQMTDDTDAVICFCHLSERDGESDDWRVQEYVCDWRCVYEWTSGVCKAGWLLDESSLTCSYSFCLGWLSSHYVWCCVQRAHYHIMLSSDCNAYKIHALTVHFFVECIFTNWWKRLSLIRWACCRWGIIVMLFYCLRVAEFVFYIISHVFSGRLLLSWLQSVHLLHVVDIVFIPPSVA